jgi:hypothetical protein
LFASAASMLMLISFGGWGSSQFWVITPSKSVPIATTTSASSHRSPTGLAWIGPGMQQG